MEWNVKHLLLRKTDEKQRSSLQNYTSNNMRQHDTTRAQHDTTRVHHDTTRVQHKYNTSTIRHSTSTTQPNTSSKEALAAKIGLCFALFVTELYIFS